MLYMMTYNWKSKVWKTASGFGHVYNGLMGEWMLGFVCIPIHTYIKGNNLSICCTQQRFYGFGIFFHPQQPMYLTFGQSFY